MKRFSKVFTAAVALTAALGLLAGCSDGGTDPTASGGSAHVLTVGKLLPLQAVDPHKVNDGMSNEVLTTSSNR